MASKVSSGSRRRGVGWVAPALALSVLLGACGDDAGTTAASQPKAEVGDYCAKTLAIETYPEPDIDFQSASPEEVATGIRAYAAKLVPLAEQAQSAAPAEVRKDIDVLVGAVRQVAQTGDFESSFEAPPVKEAETRAHGFDLKSCKWARVDVSGADYSYSGVPKTMKAGPVSFEFSNAGAEPHELALLKVNDGVKESIEQIVALPEAQGKAKVTKVAGTFAAPGKGDYAVANLKPGRYGFACFVPVGGGKDGPPHVTKGMYAEFEVA